MTNISILILRAAIRAYPHTELVSRALVRRNRIAYIAARQRLGDRSLLAGGAWSKSISVLHRNRDAIVAAVVMIAAPVGIAADIISRGL